MKDYKSGKIEILEENDKVDFHTHSYYSDGELSPTDVVKRGKAKGLVAMALTDHDGIAGTKEAWACGQKVGMTIISGIEISTEIFIEGEILKKIGAENWRKDREPKEVTIGLHILGYGIELDNQPLQKKLLEVKRFREKRNVELIETINELGYKLSLEDIVFREGQDYIGKPLISRALAKKGYIKTPKEAFEPNGIFAKKEIRRIEKKKIGTREAIDLIHQASGVAVLAHPGRIRKIGVQGADSYFKNVEGLVDILVKQGLDGIEANYEKHSQREKAFFRKIGEQRKLLVTKGSDFHGDQLDNIAE